MDLSLPCAHVPLCALGRATARASCQRCYNPISTYNSYSDNAYITTATQARQVTINTLKAHAEHADTAPTVLKCLNVLGYCIVA